MKIPYGYTRDALGNISIVEQKADVVRLIFHLHHAGFSLGKITAYLERHCIPSPTGNPTWSRAAIDKVLSNPQYLPIVGLESYIDASFDKHDRSNVDEETERRKAVRFCSQCQS